jgi:isochorismate hydrolase
MNFDRILLDIETQRDLFLPKGRCYITNARKAATNIFKLFRWSKQQDVRVVSTVLRLRPGMPGPFGPAPHLIEGTEGEMKLPRTLLSSHVDLGLRNSTDLPPGLLEDYQQVIFEKRQTDIFKHAKAERLITELPMVTFVICGAGVGHGILEASVGLRNRGFGVILAEDAVADLDNPELEMSVLRMRAKGVVFAKTGEIVKPRASLRAKPFKDGTFSHNS